MVEVTSESLDIFCPKPAGHGFAPRRAGGGGVGCVCAPPCVVGWSRRSVTVSGDDEI